MEESIKTIKIVTIISIISFSFHGLWDLSSLKIIRNHIYLGSLGEHYRIRRLEYLGALR